MAGDRRSQENKSAEFMMSQSVLYSEVPLYMTDVLETALEKHVLMHQVKPECECRVIVEGKPHTEANRTKSYRVLNNARTLGFQVEIGFMR